jgi:hypothetical protein
VGSDPPFAAPQPPWDSLADDLRSAILDTALRQIGELDLADLLKCLTPPGLAAEGAFSPSAVRYHFGDEVMRFDRRALTDALVELIAGRLRAQAQSAAEGYIAAIASMSSVDDLGGIEEALADDLHWFTPGPAGPEAAATERLYLLSVAMCDTSGSLSARLRGMREDILASYDQIYAHGLQATSRAVAPGMTLRDVNLVINAFLEGVVILQRQHARMPLPDVADVVARIFVALTVEADGQAGQ